DVWGAAVYAIDNDLAPVLTMSFGECEQGDLGDLPGYRSTVQQANAEGITFFAAAGDQGAADCEDQGATIAQDGLAVDIPGSIPEVTSMGGTELNDSGGSYWNVSGNAISYIPEPVWNDTTVAGQLAAGGGGTSVFFPRPGWQTGPGVPTGAFRSVPDLSLSASADHVGYVIYSSGSSTFVGGTSAAAPTMAGIFALINQYLMSNGGLQQPGLGNVNPTLYRLGASAPTVFHDVTVSNNAVPCAIGSPDCATGTMGISAGARYDAASGWGSVDANALAGAWKGAAPAVSAVVPSIDQNPVFQQAPDGNGNSWVFHLTLTEEAGIATRLTGM